MSVIERESSTAKTGLWYIVVQGVPAAFGMVEDHPLQVPAAIYGNLRIGPDDNISEDRAFIWAALKFGDLPDVGPYTAEPYEARVRIGDFTARLSDNSDRRLAGLFAYLCTQSTALKNDIEASLDQSIQFDVVNAAGLSFNEIIYIGAETFVITEIDGNEITARRGRFGSEREYHPAGAGVYKTPPFWKGRRIALCRAFAEEAGDAYEVRWVGNMQSVSPVEGVSEWEISAVDELRMLDREVQLPGQGKIFSITFNTDYNSYILNINNSEGSSFNRDILKQHPFIQVDESIIKVKPFMTGASDVEFLQVVETGCFGTERPWEVIEPVHLLDPQSNTLNEYLYEGKYKPGSKTVEQNFDCHQLIIIEDEHLIKGGDGSEDGVKPNGILLKLLQSISGDGTGGDYDALPFGVGLPSSMIDLTWIEKAREKYSDLTGSLVLGWNGDAFNLRDVIEDYLLAPLFGKLIPQTDGRLGIRFPFELTPLATGKLMLGKAEMIFDKGVKAHYNHDDTYTDVIISYNHPVAGEEKKRIGKWVPVEISKPLGDSNDFYGYYKNKFQFNLFCCEGGNYGAFAARRMELVDFRNARPLPAIELWTRLSSWFLEIGDIVQVSTGDIPLYNPINGASSLPSALRCEVLRKEFELADEIIKLKLLPLDFGARRIGVIAPSARIVSVSAGSGIAEITVDENLFSTGVFDTETGTGGKDTAHFSVGDRVRIYNIQSGQWQSGSGGFYEITAVDNESNLITISCESTPVAAEGDIFEYAELPPVREGVNCFSQQKRVFMADDGSSGINTKPGMDEFLPSQFSPETIYDIEPYLIMLG